MKIISNKSHISLRLSREELIIVHGLLKEKEKFVGDLMYEVGAAKQLHECNEYRLKLQAMAEPLQSQIKELKSRQA